MGHEYEVYGFLLDPEIDKHVYMEVYAGSSLEEALAAMTAAKETGAGCIKLEWRP